MPLSGSVLGGLIKTNLMATGASGSNLTAFSNAVGAGIVMSIVGKAFTTTDVGSGSLGTGTGTGITGLSSGTMTSDSLGAMSSQGSNASALMNSIAMAVVTHMAVATLMSVDPAVGVGSGSIVPGSITVIISEMASNIQSQLSSGGASGSNLANLALAIATGVAGNIQSAGTGTLVIAGGVPGGPSAGSGTGTIS